MIFCIFFTIVGGWALDRYGPRLVFFIMGVFTGLSLLLTSRADSLWQLYLAYSLLLYAQRQQLHRAVAEWLEQAHADDLAPYYPLLAHHWGKAAEVAHAEPVLVLKTIDYLEKAGGQALQDGAYREAAGFLSQVVALAEEWEGKGAAERDGQISPSPRIAQRLAHWQRLLGEAHYGLGQPVEGRKHLQRALGLLGQLVPTMS